MSRPLGLDGYRKVDPFGDWYLVRWGGTRKGAGTFYTRVEKAAATNPKRLLTTTEPLPQFVHRIAAKAGEPMLARVIVQIRQPQAKR